MATKAHGPAPPPPDPFLFQLAANADGLMKQAVAFRAQGQIDIAAICMLTKDAKTLASLGNATGQKLEAIKYDPGGHGGLAGVGPRGLMVRVLREIFGNSSGDARAMELHRPHPAQLPTFIWLPDGRGAYLIWSGGSQ